MSLVISILVGMFATAIGISWFIATRDYLDADTKRLAVRKCVTIFLVGAVIACVLTLALGGVAVPVIIGAGLLTNLFGTVRRRRTES